jgi:cbb3-type cytochrome c oxidase subunit III
MVVGVAGARAQEPAQARPPEVTDSLIERGRKVFAGSARCAACHGTQGEGTEAGPSLVDGEWLHGDGGYAQIVQVVRHGVSRRESETGRPMPMRGLVPLGEAGLRAVAAYVWSLSRQRDPGEPDR